MKTKQSVKAEPGAFAPQGEPCIACRAVTTFAHTGCASPVDKRVVCIALVVHLFCGVTCTYVALFVAAACKALYFILMSVFLFVYMLSYLLLKRVQAALSLCRERDQWHPV